MPYSVTKAGPIEAESAGRELIDDVEGCKADMVLFWCSLPSNGKVNDFEIDLGSSSSMEGIDWTDKATNEEVLRLVSEKISLLRTTYVFFT